VLPKLNLNSPKKTKKKTTTADQRGLEKKPSESGRGEKASRATQDDPSKRSARNKVVSTLTSNTGPFTVPPGGDALPQTPPPMQLYRDVADGAYNATSPRGGDTRSKHQFASQRELAGSTHTPRASWVSKHKQQAHGQDELGHIGEDNTRSLLSPRREKAADTLQRLRDAGQITKVLTDTNETIFLIVDGIDEKDLWKACNAIELQTLEQFEEACFLLEAALPHIGQDELRQQLIKRFTPAFIEHCADSLPTDRWFALCNAIRPSYTETIRTRLTQALARETLAIQQLMGRTEPPVSKGLALLHRLHELLHEALARGETGLARDIVVAAQRVPALYETDQSKRINATLDPVGTTDMSGLRAAAEALYGSWQQALPGLWSSPAFSRLFDGPDKDPLTVHSAPGARCASLMQVHGAGGQVHFSCHGPLDTDSVAAAVRVCQDWLAEGWVDEAEALLTSVLGAVDDPVLQRQLVKSLTPLLNSRVKHADRATAWRCIGMLARIHQSIPLSEKRMQRLVDRLSAARADLRYDFDGMRALYAVAERLRRALAAQSKATSPGLQAQITQLAQACRDDLGPLRQFHQRWKVQQVNGKVVAIDYTPGPVPGNAKQLRADEEANAQEMLRLNLNEDGELRQTLMPLQWVQPAELSPEQKNQLADQLAWRNQRLAIWQRMDEHGSAHAHERAMLIADIQRFLEDPNGPPWAVVQEAIGSACKALGWEPSPEEWLRWGILAVGQDVTGPLVKRLQQTQRGIDKRVTKDEGASETKALLFAALMDVMERHTPWSTIQATLKTIDLALDWTLSDSQVARLCLAQARRGDPAPLMDLLSRKPSVQLPPSELDALLSLLDHPAPTPPWTSLRELAAPLFERAPEALRLDYKRLLSGERRAALSTEQRPKFKETRSPKDARSRIAETKKI